MISWGNGLWWQNKSKLNQTHGSEMWLFRMWMWRIFIVVSLLLRPESDGSAEHVALWKSSQLHYDTDHLVWFCFRSRCRIFTAALPVENTALVMDCRITSVQSSLPESWRDLCVCLNKESGGGAPRSCSFTVQWPDGQQLLLQSIFHRRVKVHWAVSVFFLFFSPRCSRVQRNVLSGRKCEV